MEHYRQAGKMLLEAKDQVQRGGWTRWLMKNFELSDRTANRYMRLARVEDFSAARGESLHDAIGEKRSRSTWKPLFEAADRVNVDRLAEERLPNGHADQAT